MLLAGHLLNKLAEKQLQFQLVCNPYPKSIIWRMKRPSDDSSGEAVTRFYDGEDADTQAEVSGSKVYRHKLCAPSNSFNRLLHLCILGTRIDLPFLN